MGDFRTFLTTIKELNVAVFTEQLLIFKNDVKNITGNFLILAEKAFGFYELGKISGNPTLFFESLGKDRSYETLASIIESVFLSKEILIENINNHNLKITVKNKNEKLIIDYVGTKQAETVNYIGGGAKQYKGFEAGEYETLAEFVRVFLERFIPINKKIQEFIIIKEVAGV